MSAPTVPTRRRPLARVVLTALALGAGLLVAPAATPVAAQQDAPTTQATETATTMSFTGRGWGHGRGMSQYGAQGYATQYGWDYRQILDHYYGGTTSGNAGDQIRRIRLMAMDDKPATVAIDSGTVRIESNQGLTASGLKAVRLTKQADGTVQVEQASSCSGPWTTVEAGGATHVSVIRDSGAEPLRLCRPDGVHVWYPGELQSLVDGGVQRTINVTSIESQLRSTVPRESPASWDLDALKAQSVAARSYALAGDTRHLPYADTCDTTLCQVYEGWFKQVPGGSKAATTDPRTDRAINETLGEVRRHSNGAIARTEFSSSTGGWTAGGTFPAVEDLGDAISPRHSWTRTVDVSRLESSYGKGGKLIEVEVTQRNGLGAMGGRVLKARLHFSNGTTADVSGNAVRSATGLWSDWFAPVCGSEVRYVNALYDLFLGRTPTGPEAEAGCAQARRGERQSLTDGLARSDEWAGSQIAGLYEDILGRTADADGRAHWLGQVQRGLRIEDIAAQFYGSAEYYASAGRTTAGYVESLYVDVLGRASDADGKRNWVTQIDSGRMSRTAVAASFYASPESRTDRVIDLYDQVLGRAPDGSGRAYWVDQLRTLGDVALAAHLAASAEFYSRSLAT